MTTFYFNNKEVENMNKEFKFLQEDEETPWIARPLSPPFNKKETPVSKTLQVSGVNTWHSLWSTSTWQTPAVQQRGRSLSLVPSSSSSFYETADIITSPLHPYQSTGFMINQSTDKSIWSFDYPSMKEAERRHSIATVRPITPPPQQQESVQQLIQQLQQRQQQQINEYFSPTTAAVDVQYLGKGVSIDQIASDQPIYQIQFKDNYRTDYFYAHQQDLEVNINDMVIVEADRGYDLGKVVAVLDTMSITCSIKRIFRHATPTEIATHALKREDEEKALIVCQAKIQQKNLNMQVVDAEYQWDRRKLTFYFKSNERIDFRELVRELFKIYKTRIWMCAFNPVENE